MDTIRIDTHAVFSKELDGHEVSRTICQYKVLCHELVKGRVRWAHAVTLLSIAEGP